MSIYGRYGIRRYHELSDYTWRNLDGSKKNMMAVEIKFSFLNLSIGTIFYAEMSADTRAAVFGRWGWRGWT